MKKLRILLIAFVCVLALSVSVCASEASVDTMEVSLNVDKNGTARADVSLHVVLGDPMDSFSVTLGPNVSGVHLDAYSARVKRVDGQTVVTISGENGLPAVMDLHMTYTIRNTVRSEGDAQIFAVRLLGGVRDAIIEKLSVSVQMPEAFEAIPEFTSGYYADGIDNYLDIQVSENGLLTAASTTDLLAGETLDLKLNTQPDYFTLYNVAGRTLLIDRIVMILLVLFGAVYWWRSLRFDAVGITVQSRAPMGVEPGVAGMLITGQAPDLALMTMRWAASGYLRVVRLRGKKVMMIRQIPMGNERSTYEQEVFSRLFAKRQEVLCGSRIWHAAQKKANKVAADYWYSRLYEKKPGRPGLLRGIAVLFCGVAALFYADQVLPSMYLRLLVLAVIALAGICWGALLQYALKRLPMRKRKGPLICLTACVLAMLVVWQITGYGSVLFLALIVSALTQLALLFGPKRRHSGAALLAELLGWRRYLQSLTPEDARQLLRADPQYYYKNLLFAEALGVGRRFSRAFDNLKLDECAFLERETKPLPRQAVQFRAFFVGTLAIVRGEAAKKPSEGQRKHPSSSDRKLSPAERTAPGARGSERTRNNNPRRRPAEVYEPME